MNLDSCSLQQLREESGNDAARVATAIRATVAERGKQHNTQTGSGGMFVGRVREIGAESPWRGQLTPGDRIASLVSLTLTPLHLESIEHVDVETGRVRVRGTAVLFASAGWAKLPEDIEPDVALAVLDVAGAPAQVRRMTQTGMIVAVVGADGKSGLLSCAQAKERCGKEGRVIAIVPNAASDGSQVLTQAGLADCVIECDARDAATLFQKFSAQVPQLADLVVNCVNVAGTETGSILCARDGGVVYFFSMCTSFTAAALGAEGLGKDVRMIIGNGYAPGHAEIALQTLRDHPELHAYFQKRFGGVTR